MECKHKHCKKKSRISAKGIQRITLKNESIKETEELKDHKLNEIRDIIISFFKIGEKKVQAFKLENIKRKIN